MGDLDAMTVDYAKIELAVSPGMTSSRSKSLYIGGEPMAL